MRIRDVLFVVTFPLKLFAVTVGISVVTGVIVTVLYWAGFAVLMGVVWLLVGIKELLLG